MKFKIYKITTCDWLFKIMFWKNNDLKLDNRIKTSNHMISSAINDKFDERKI